MHICAHMMVLTFTIHAGIVFLFQSTLFQTHQSQCSGTAKNGDALQIRRKSGSNGTSVGKSRWQYNDCDG